MYELPYTCIVHHAGTNTFGDVSLIWSRFRMAHKNSPLIFAGLPSKSLSFSPFHESFFFFCSFYLEAVVSFSNSAPGLLILKQSALDKEIPGVLQKNSRETRHNGSHAFNSHIRKSIVPQVPPATP